MHLAQRMSAGEGGPDEIAEHQRLLRQIEQLAEARAMPRLTKHEGWEWHLHLTTPDAPLVDRLGTEAAMGIADLVREEIWAALSAALSMTAMRCSWTCHGTARGATAILATAAIGPMSRPTAHAKPGGHATNVIAARVRSS